MVLVPILDDWKSLIHVGLGATMVFHPLPWIIFFAYEFCEWLYHSKRGMMKREAAKHFAGDLIEAILGYFFTSIGLRTL